MHSTSQRPNSRPLTFAALRSLAPRSKEYKVTDGKGLHVLVKPSGAILWRFNYRFNGKQKTLALGRFGEVSLQQARNLRDEARAELAKGVDPAEKRRLAKLGTFESSFGAVANEWLEHKYQHDVGEPQYERTRRRLELYVLPFVGEKDVGHVSTKDMLAIIRSIERTGKIDTAKRVRTACDQIFRYAAATGRVESNPAQMIRDVVRKPRHNHHPSRTEPKGVADLLRTIHGEGNNYRGRLLVREALLLGSMLFFRPCEIRDLRWSKINIDMAEITHRPSKQGGHSEQREVIVPVPRQLVELLKRIKPLSQGSLARGGGEDYVFPGAKPGKPMSVNTLNKALRSMGIDTKTDFTGHGFRAMARTMIREYLPQFRVDAIEMALSHSVKDALGRAYNRTDLLAERREMLQAWADYLDGLRQGVGL